MIHIFQIVAVYLLIKELCFLWAAKENLAMVERMEAWDKENPDVKHENKPKFYRDYSDKHWLWAWVFVGWALVGLFTSMYLFFTVFFIVTLVIYPELSSHLHGRKIRLHYLRANAVFVILSIIYLIVVHFNEFHPL